MCQPVCKQCNKCDNTHDDCPNLDDATDTVAGPCAVASLSAVASAAFVLLLFDHADSVACVRSGAGCAVFLTAVNAGHCVPLALSIASAISYAAFAIASGVQSSPM